ncbi:MAG: TonB-dependent receptor [Bacteroidota bacterium]
MSSISYAQETFGSVSGTVRDASTLMPLQDAYVFIDGKSKGAQTDSIGNFRLDGIAPGSHSLVVSHIGYQRHVDRKLMVSTSSVTAIEILLIPDQKTIEGVTIRPSDFPKDPDRSITTHAIGQQEIQRNPGSDNDVSKVIRALPGVATVSSFRNDLIIRGGAPNENRFFIEDIEVPVLNHLTTQGATGGVYSIINSNHLTGVDYMSSSFRANRGNALSSVFDFRLREGNEDTTNYSIWMGGTEAGVSVEKNLGVGSGLLFSARRSYRQYILQLLNFAFLPVYNDATLKLRLRTGDKSSLTFLGIGAIDDFTLNKEVGDNEIQRYLLDNLPLSEQSNYTVGLVYRTFFNNASLRLIASRSGLRNSAEKYFQNDDSLGDNLLLKYDSKEESNRFRTEYTWAKNQTKLLLGAGVDGLKSTFDVYNKSYNINGEQVVSYDSEVQMLQYSAFAQWTRSVLNNRLTLNIGGRVDGSDYNEQTNDLSRNVSARLLLTYKLTDAVSISTGASNYTQLPPMNTLGYAVASGLVNENVVRYLRSTHYTAGFSWENEYSGKLTVEGYYKYYPDYLVSLRDSISLAHIPVDFGVFGNFPVSYDSDGRAYGVELFYQQKLFKGYYGMISYTLGWSEYATPKGDYIPSAWDARHIANLTFGKKINDKWEVGLSYRMQSPLPFTPFDFTLSAYRPVWDANNQGVRDYSQLNNSRGKYTNLINARVDRVFRFRGWVMNVFLDLENILADADSQQILILDRQKDGISNDGVVLNPSDPYEQQRYALKYLQNAQGALIPTMGVIIKF